jgi:hypothetical protein
MSSLETSVSEFKRLLVNFDILLAQMKVVECISTIFELRSWSMKSLYNSQIFKSNENLRNSAKNLLRELAYYLDTFDIYQQVCHPKIWEYLVNIYNNFSSCNWLYVKKLEIPILDIKILFKSIAARGMFISKNIKSYNFNLFALNIFIKKFLILSKSNLVNLILNKVNTQSLYYLRHSLYVYRYTLQHYNKLSLSNKCKKCNVTFDFTERYIMSNSNNVCINCYLDKSIIKYCKCSIKYPCLLKYTSMYNGKLYKCCSNCEKIIDNS